MILQGQAPPIILTDPSKITETGTRRTLVLTVRPGEEVMESLTRQLGTREVRDAAVVSLIGAVDGCAIGNMRSDDARTDVVTEYRQPFELSGAGEVKDGRLHLHCVLSGEGGAAMGGHLHWARVETWFVNAYVVPVK